MIRAETRGPALDVALRWPRLGAAPMRLDQGGTRRTNQVIPDPAQCNDWPAAQPGEIVAWLPIIRSGCLRYVLGAGRYTDIRAQCKGLPIQYVWWIDENGRRQWMGGRS